MKLQKHYLLLISVLFVSATTYAQYDTTKIKESIQLFQDQLNKEYKDKKKSPLEPEKIKDFTGHDFFLPDLTYAVQAKLTVTEAAPFFKMKTSSSQVRDFRQYGFLVFTLHGTEYRLPVYQSQQLMHIDEYADYLFLPFTDLTNGKETYSAGRYIDLRMPTDSDILLVDFNKAYNPLCAYSNRYSCPVVPAENHLDIEVYAGVKYNKH